ncbi:unnamed protein product [Macrosiphum euphorbiae]|uniref:Uncharacterized protein n=1 Tax=Macrosiphum euphorbiae TaxID=13131 RepID=A0AAV0XSI5_9HEMI|nr:unnamed protein product [Macrosiphum euphorbiae]
MVEDESQIKHFLWCEERERARAQKVLRIGRSRTERAWTPLGNSSSLRTPRCRVVLETVRGVTGGGKYCGSYCHQYQGIVLLVVIIHGPTATWANYPNVLSTYCSLQWGKLAFLSKSNAIVSQFSFEGVGRNSDFITDQMALHTSFPIMLAVEIPILYV